MESICEERHDDIHCRTAMSQQLAVISCQVLLRMYRVVFVSWIFNTLRLNAFLSRQFARNYRVGSNRMCECLNMKDMAFVVIPEHVIQIMKL